MIGPAALQHVMSHVHIIVQHSGPYCRFAINKIHNRLDCPAESRVTYMKAFCHAITTFVLADLLTGRTGTEEGLHFLSSGNAQSWAPLDGEAYRLLLRIAELLPKGSYYPADIRLQQKVFWLDSLAFPAQDDGFDTAVRLILRQCRLLYLFNAGAPEPPREEFASDTIPIPTRYYQGIGQNHIDSDRVHMCRNFDRLLAYTSN